MSESTTCPKCGGEIVAGGAAGLCPKCLLIGAETDAELTAAVGATAVHGGAWTPPTVEELADAIPGCRVTELIGRGGMGAVYRAQQAELDRTVAVKVLPKALGDEGGFAERFRREAQVMAKLDHPNIVKVFDFGQAGSGHFYFVMEYVEGMDLQRMIRSGELCEKDAIAIVGQVCDALQYAHGEGFVHRDIKPANLMLTKDGKVKVGDFGIARVLGEREESGLLTAVGQGLGTAVYAAPEQLSGAGAIDHRADIYSLGVVLYEMLTGEVPRGAFDLPSEKVRVDVRLDEVVVRAMKSAPERRYQAVGDVKSDVETIASGSVPPQPPVAAAAPAHSHGGRGAGSGRWKWGCVVVAIVLAGLAVISVPLVLWLSYSRVAQKEASAREEAMAAANRAELAREEAIARDVAMSTVRQALELAEESVETPGDAAVLVERSREAVSTALKMGGDDADVLAVAADVYRTLGMPELEREMLLRFKENARTGHPRWSEVERALEDRGQGRPGDPGEALNVEREL